MYPGWLIVTALLITVYCIAVLIRKSLLCMREQDCQKLPMISLLFLVRNQEDTIEGLIRRVFADAYTRSVELIAVDTGSTDRTQMILERLAAKFEMVKFVSSGEVQGIPRKIRKLCSGNIIYYIDLTSSINYRLMANTIDSILIGSKISSLYRTSVLYKHNTKFNRMGSDNLRLKKLPRDKGKTVRKTVTQSNGS